MTKVRVSKCTTENLPLVNRLREQAKSVKLIVKKSTSVDKKKTGKRSQVFKTPKSVILFKKEAFFAGKPSPQSSGLIQYIIKKDAKVFRKITEKASSKTRKYKRGRYGTTQEK